MTSEELVVNNMKFVFYIANKYYSNLDLEDTVSIGNIGLVKAAKKFDITKDVQFATFAFRCITNEINQSLREKRKYEKLGAISGNKIIFQNEGDGTEISLFDTLSSEEDIELEFENRMILKKILSNCNPKEKTIISMFENDKTQKEIAKEIGVSQSYVSRMLKKLQKYA